MLKVKKSCLFLLPDSGNLGFQLSQHHDIMVRVDSWFGGMKAFLSQKTLHIILPSDGCILNYLHVAMTWTQFRFYLYGNAMSCHQWWCSPGNCHRQLHIDSAGFDKLVFGDLFALVSVSMRPTWYKLCGISVLSILFPVHWSQLRFLIIIWQFVRMSWMRYFSFIAG